MRNKLSEQLKRAAPGGPAEGGGGGVLLYVTQRATPLSAGGPWEPGVI